MVKSAIKLKAYKHFDGFSKSKSIEDLVANPNQVVAHPFYPLLYFRSHWTKHTKKNAAPDQKSREILYAARVDAAIMSEYRAKLSGLYEQKLKEAGLSDNVIAYRRILKLSGGGKSNIDFAHDAFVAMRNMGTCSVFAFDISKFFNSLCHKHIEASWKSLIRQTRLPKDHLTILNRVTRYSSVDMEAVLRALGIKGLAPQKNDEERIGYLVNHKDIKQQICVPAIFRKQIAENRLIISWKNRGRPDYCIPQGLPISDLIANFYMLDFDIQANEWQIV